MGADSAEPLPVVAVVVPCRNEARNIHRLLDALAAQTRPADRIVVVDDRSSDSTVAVVRAWSLRHASVRVVVIDGPGRGAGPALNAGIAAAPDGIIVRLDGHCQPDPHYIEQSLQTLGSPKVGVAGGIWKIQAGAETLTARGIAAVLSHPLGSGGAEYRTAAGSEGETRIVDTVPFGAFRRELWEQLGGFDETLLRNQDYDFNYRVRLTGRRVLLNPAIVSVYRARPTYATLARQYFDYGYWKIVMLRKFPASIIPRQMLPLALIPLLVAAALWAAIAASAEPLWVIGVYLALNLAGGAHAAVRVRDVRLTPHAAIALLVLQTAWSTGAWASIVSGMLYPAPRPT